MKKILLTALLISSSCNAEIIRYHYKDTTYVNLVLQRASSDKRQELSKTLRAENIKQTLKVLKKIDNPADEISLYQTLSNVYLYGIYTAKNYQKAYQWKLVARALEQETKATEEWYVNQWNVIEKLEKDLTKQAIIEAQNKAAEWLKSQK